MFFVFTLLNIVNCFTFVNLINNKSEVNMNLNEAKQILTNAGYTLSESAANIKTLPESEAIPVILYACCILSNRDDIELPDDEIYEAALEKAEKISTRYHLYYEFPATIDEFENIYGYNIVLPIGAKQSELYDLGKQYGLLDFEFDVPRI